jgi:lipid II:glycine glycyltransferase (peptidoglycan interpeptide bridge formation enzyme)
MVNNEKTLNSKYNVEVDMIEKCEWYEALMNFNDATIYQTWSYGSVRWGESKLSHLVLKKDGEIVGLAQVIIIKIPLINAGIGYIPWGPIWQKKDAASDFESISYLIKALRKEYVVKRKLLLRITPNAINEDHDFICEILKKEGFILKSSPYRTLLIDLSLSMEELYKGSARRWRRALKTSEQKGLKVIEGTENHLYEVFKILYTEMVERKGFLPGINIYEFQEIQKDLPTPFKMKIMICEHEGKAIAALIASLIGQKGIGLLGATATSGMNLGGFQLLNWRMIHWMKENGAVRYDFGGYNPIKNPGTASFKEGLPGKDVLHIGQFEACENLLSSFIVVWAERFSSIYNKIKLTFFKNSHSKESGKHKGTID